MKNECDKTVKFAHENLENAIKFRMRNCETGELEEEEDFMMYTINSSSPDAHLNGVMVTGSGDFGRSGEIIEKAAEFFRDRGMDYSVWIRVGEDDEMEAFLKSLGKVPKRFPGSAVMYAREAFRDVDMSISAEGGKKELRAVRVPLKPAERLTEEEWKYLRDYMGIISDAFGKGDEVSRKIVESAAVLSCSEGLCEGEAKGEESCVTVLYLGDIPVGGTITYTRDGVAGIYWLGVSSDFRRLGIGSILTKLGTNEGIRAGGKTVILQASLAGEEVYGKLGYRTVTRYRGCDM